MAERINAAFNETARLVFGAEVGPIDEYGDWLSRHLHRGKYMKTAIEKRELYVLPGFFYVSYIPMNRIISEEEVSKVGKAEFDPGRVKGLKDLAAHLRMIEYYNIELKYGKNEGIENALFYGNVVNLYNSCDVHDSKNVGHSNFITQYCEGIFGCYRMFFSKFCIHCYNSSNITLCFECDSCKNCSGLMFCHNCENVHDSLFCSNTKNKRYAVFNREIGREKFLELKERLCTHVLENLEKDKEFKENIYTLGR